MAQVQCEVDSIRIAAFRPGELTLILRQKECPNAYLPLWIGQREGQILADVLHGRPHSDKQLDGFLFDNDAVDSSIGSATVYLKGSSVFAKVLLSPDRRPHEVRCPIGIALALAVRADAPIFIDYRVFENAGVSLSTEPC